MPSLHVTAARDTSGSTKLVSFNFTSQPWWRAGGIIKFYSSEKVSYSAVTLALNCTVAFWASRLDKSYSINHGYGFVKECDVMTLEC